MTAISTREDLLKATKRRFAHVDCEVGTFRIRSLTERERSENETWYLTKKGLPDKDRIGKIRVRLLTRCIVDDKGNAIFTDADIDSLSDLDGKVITQLFEACAEHCGFDKDAIEEILELEKNSE